ncbi:MAG: DNA-processing protein DprA [Spiribacter sp.]|nr:DNA-processing protein DprA [Spiribacter sp.]MDR9489395.1 DNA-processing protein DprA [Spiribacter sp.]
MPNDDDIGAWLTLARLDGIGPHAQRMILERYRSAADFLAASEQHRRAQALPDRVVTAPRQMAAAEAAVRADQDWLSAGDNRAIITRADPRYPPQLQTIPDPPAVLYIRGNPDLLHEPQIAIVGSRSGTPAGLETATDFAAHLAALGLVVTSGLALGIDTAAHEGALVGSGKTIAVMATGPDRLYPKQNADLAERMTQHGAIVTEMGVGTPVQRGLFPRRNRLISGLSLGVLVIEAGIRSGALGSARAATEQNREVLAIPGSIHNPVARGCHALIRDGARLVESVTDVVEELRGAAEQHAMTLATPKAAQPAIDAQSPKVLDPEYAAVLGAIGDNPVRFDTLVSQLGLTPDILSSMLLNLELSGHIAPCSGGRYQRINNRAGG